MRGMDGFSVGEVARMAGVSVRTLHHYDAIGLLASRERTEGGYRVYTDAAVARLRRILFYRELDFRLGEIAAMLADPDAGTDDHLRDQHRRLRARKARTDELLRAIEDEMEHRAMGIDVAKALAEEHRRHLCRWFFECTPEMHRDIAALYVSDPRYMETWDDVAPGFSQYVHDAVVANAG